MVFSAGAFAVPADSDDEPEEHENLSADGLLLPYIAYVQVRKKRL